MAASPAFASIPILALAAVSAANTNRDGTGTIVDGTPANAVSVTAPAAGRRIDRIKVKATGQTPACVLTIFVHDGTAYRLYTEIALPAVTPSTTVKSAEIEQPVNDLVLQSGEKIGAAVTVVPTSGDIKVWFEGGDLT